MHLSTVAWITLVVPLVAAAPAAPAAPCEVRGRPTVPKLQAPTGRTPA